MSKLGRMPRWVMDIANLKTYNSKNIMKINQNKVEMAINVIEAAKLPELPSELKGDIASFGAGIIQSGLLPSVLFFSEGGKKEAEELVEKLQKSGNNEQDEEASTKARRALMLQWLFEVMQVHKAEEYSSTPRPMLEYVRKHRNEPIVLDNITEAAIALKIAMRAFKFTQKTDK